MLLWMADMGTGGGGGDEEDYLSKLAKSILSKEKAPPRPAGGGNSGVNRLPAMGGGAPQPGATSPAPPQASSRPVAPPPSPGAQSPADRRPPSSMGVPVPGTGTDRGWTRTVDVRDQDGNFLPGTIFVFEDGTVAVYKEHNAAKDYHIVYQLMETGRAVPQGIALQNYELEPVGRLSPLCLEHVSRTNHWERDMVVFHLLKFKDVAYIPKIVEGATQERSSTVVPRLTPEQLGAPGAPVGASAPPSPPASTAAHLGHGSKPERGLRVRIDFGPGRSWEAVYWGKDELGHVVAHHTHERWALMHLDLGRFKNGVHWGEQADEATLEKIEKDCLTK